MARQASKSDLPSKTCLVCGLPFTWRKKWAGWGRPNSRDTSRHFRVDPTPAAIWLSLSGREDSSNT